MTWSKNIYIQEGLEGASSIIDLGVLVNPDKKMNFAYFGTAPKVALNLHTGQLL